MISQAHIAQGDIAAARAFFELMQDPPVGVAAPGNHERRYPKHHHQAGQASAPATDDPIYREPSTWEIMVRSEIAAGEMGRAAALLSRVEERAFPEGGTLPLFSGPSPASWRADGFMVCSREPDPEAADRARPRVVPGTLCSLPHLACTRLLLNLDPKPGRYVRPSAKCRSFPNSCPVVPHHSFPWIRLYSMYNLRQLECSQ